MNAIGNGQLKQRACVRCAAAKAKCSFNGSDKFCERCRRLKRECILEDRPRRKKEKQSSRVKALEEKVETLLSMMGPEKGGMGVPTSGPRIDLETPAPTDDDSMKSVASSTFEPGHRFDIINTGLLTIAAADIILEKYKCVRTKLFPFVVVPPEIDAATLREKSPFLFLAIMTAGIEGDHLLQRRLGVECRKILCERVMIGADKDFDLLQGLLVHLGWSHFHFSPAKKQLYMLFLTAYGLVIDLELDRCPAHRDQRVASAICCHTVVFGQPKTLPAQCRRSTAEIRALFGCFYISSSLAVMRKELAMTHTKWIDNCCKILEAEQEYPTDVDAVAFIRAKCLVKTIGERFSYSDPALVRSHNDSVLQMSLNGFKKEIADLEASHALSAANTNYALIAEIQALPVTLYEIALYRDHSNTSTPSQTSNLWNLLTSARDLLTHVLEIPKEIITELPSGFFNLFPYALVVLSIVSRMPTTSAWDHAIASREADFMDFTQRIQTKFGTELSTTTPDAEPDQRDVWQFFSRGLSGLSTWHQRCESTSSAEAEIEVSLVSPYHTMKCAMADTMTAFASMRFQKTTQHSCGAEHEAQPVVQLYGTTEPTSGTATGNYNHQSQQDMLGSSIGDNMMWQSIIDDFSMFPTTTGFPGAPPVLY
ncbi:hypothetical protein PV08_09006 [Exophiala spinifera]|uniref:Zn(2)-C6 fungal-type domain-containing protein n=1 Tax=Exophiala spinifera TaxID=91928 RepID=A0A0D2BKC4_9EURO|nr:uncharacterized protein PV08_09006 [Exophiala spinifera]KIW11734.1 hypothetical protein PV08_09006 [Exophiala spinifera]